MVSARNIMAFLRGNGTEFRFAGDDEITINTMSNLQELEDHSICWIKDETFATESVVAELRECTDVLLVCPFEVEGVSVIITDYPKSVFFSILNRFFYYPFEHSIAKNATVLTDRIGGNVHIGAGCYIGANVEIGDNTVIHPNVSVISPCRIGHDCEIFSGVVIGADGFGYYLEDNGLICKVEHFGGVVIGDSVEIGANACIDRGTIGNTVVGDNSKIDNLVHIAHNVRIGKSVFVVAGALVCGSVELADRSYVAPGGIIKNQLKVGRDGFVGLGAVATHDVEEGTVVAGIPAEAIRKLRRGDK